MNENNNPDTVELVEKRLHDELAALKDPNNIKSIQVKKAIVRRVNNLTKHLKNIDDKQINGKQYPSRTKSLYDPTPQTEEQKKELLKLIDSVEDGIDYTKPEHELGKKWYIDKINKNRDLNGLYITDPASADYDKGWKQPKQMNPKPFFK